MQKKRWFQKQLGASFDKHKTEISKWHIIANQPDSLQKMTNSLLVNVDIPINTKRLKDYLVSI